MSVAAFCGVSAASVAAVNGVPAIDIAYLDNEPWPLASGYYQREDDTGYIEREDGTPLQRE